MSVKPQFWKPGTDLPGSSEDRKTEEEHAGVQLIYNPFHSLSIETQRQKLPIFHNRNQILYLVEKYQSVIVIGETGSGKSTQIPQYLIETGWTTGNKMIGVTQPRRVAATTLAMRVAEERGCLLGDEVGYSIRFDDTWDIQKTKIKFLTEGILIREIMSDPLLRRYSVLIIDEVHERTLQTDILLGLLKKILKKRSDLRVIISSATMDVVSLKEFLNFNETDDESKDTSAIISVRGKCYPVEIFYSSDPVADYIKASVETVIKIHEYESEGDVLVFLTGQDEVDQAVSLLIDYARTLKDMKKKNLMKLFVVPLYGSLPTSSQLKVFQPAGRGTRKVVVATNIAEASVTISRIAFVVDCGFVKLRYYNNNTYTDSLVVVPVSQASAEQRSGRAGRTLSGKAYRLYPEAEFLKLPRFTVPEIQRSNLAGVLLQLKALGIDNILRFNFLDAPPSQNFLSGVELLYAIGALDDNANLTQPLGMQMAEFPLSPLFSKMLLSSGEFGCSEEAVIIAAMLQIQNVFVSPPNQSTQAKRMHRLFWVKEGDFITLLNVFKAFLKAKKSRQWCEAKFLHYKGLLRASEIKSHLEKLLRKFKIASMSCDGDVDAICRCITAGFFSNAAYLHHSGVYKTVRGDYTLHIHPTSVLYTEKQPQWVVFNEVIHTSKEFMQDITVIDPKWLCELAPHFYQYGTNQEVLFTVIK